MNVEKTISGSQLLQKSSNNGHGTTAEERTTIIQNSIAERTTLPEGTYEGQTLDKKEIEKMIAGLNDFLKPTETALHFEFHEKLDEYYVTIINPQTKEVIKEIPPKKLLDAYASMAEFLGFIVDEKI
ncbi:flagellar protein FlaG [Aquibacillus kalidii]|uniref:flagellar protein FlaG n=1 Tax=Aquibacillus kalidii TaxID=2762597 RepID=UPI001647542C|nr:flagellar protein FlaG [Aquibacillus kalidii]